MAVRINSVRECILYEYAKLIADRAVEGRAGVAASAREGRAYWSFVALTFKKLADGRLQPSSVLRENKQLIEQADRCAYCGAAGAKLQWEHILPLSRGGSDTVDNLVLACAPCNLAKGARQPLEWYAQRGLDRKEIPRLVMGKLLKQVLEVHRQQGTLEASEYPVGEGLHLWNVCQVIGSRQ
jgi:hypothetical protein